MVGRQGEALKRAFPRRKDSSRPERPGCEALAERWRQQRTSVTSQGVLDVLAGGFGIKGIVGGGRAFSFSIKSSFQLEFSLVCFSLYEFSF